VACPLVPVASRSAALAAAGRLVARPFGDGELRLRACVYRVAADSHLLVLVLHPDLNQEVTSTVITDVAGRNRRLPDFKRIGGYLIWDKDFPRTASMKIKRNELAEQIRQATSRSSVKEL